MSTAQQRREALKRALIGAVAGAVLFAGIRLIVPRSYTSSSSLLFSGASGSGGPVGSAGSAPSPEVAAGGAPGSADQPSLPLMQGVLSVPQPGTSPGSAGLILKSRESAAEMVSKFGLTKVWRMSFERTMERFEQSFACTAGVSGDLKISFTDTSPERSRDVVAEALEVLKRSVEKLSLDPAKTNLAFLKDNLDRSGRDCAKAQDALVEFQRKMGGAPPDMQLQSLGQLYGDLQKDLVTSQVEAETARANAKAISEVGAKIMASAQDPAGSDKALVTILYNEMVSKEAALSTLRRKFTDRRPEVVQARDEAEVARRNLRKEIDRQVAGIKSGASPYARESLITALTAAARAEGLRRAASEIRAKLEALPAAQAKYAQLVSNLKDERSRLTLVRSEYVRAQLIAQPRAPHFVVLDQPSVPARANGWDWWSYGAIGFFVGPFAMLAGWIGKWIRDSIKYMSQ